MAKKEQSIAADQAAVATLTAPANLPALFTQPVEEMETRFSSPYVTFAHPKRADEYAKLTGKFGKVEEGDMYYIAGDELLKLDRAKMGFLVGKQFWARSDAGGKVLEASWKEKPKPFKERIEAVVLLYFDDRIVPCNVHAKSTKCPAFVKMANALVAASDSAAWAAESEAHKHTLVCQQPFMRFYADVELGEKRIGAESGLPYRPCHATIKPTTTVEWALLKKLCEDPETAKAMQDAADRFNSQKDKFAKLVPADK